MGCVDTESLSSVFLLPNNIAIEAVYPSKTHLTIQVACELKSAACPLCQLPSERIHGSYRRTVADVPCGGRRVTLALTVRKFVCGTPECPRQIFTERLPALVQAWLRGHPEVDIVSRDRAGEYAAAARKGAPQARAYCRQIPCVEACA
jgi:transposase